MSCKKCPSINIESGSFPLAVLSPTDSAKEPKKGWIRLRYSLKAQSWTAQLSGFTDRQKEYLVNWCRRIRDGKYGDNIGKFIGFRIINEKGEVLFFGNFSDYLG